MSVDSSHVSASWDRRALGDVLVAKYGKALPQKDRRGGQFGVYGSNGPVGAHDEAITSAPVIVIGRKGSVGAINYSDEPVWPIDTTYFVDEFDGLDAQFVRRLLESLRLEQLDRSTAIPGLSRSQLYEQEVAVPPLPEQRQIAAWLDQIDARCALIADRLAAGHAIVGQLRGAVLGAACSGRLTTDWRSAHQVQTVPPGRALSSQAQRHGSGAENSDNFTQIPESWGWWSVESVISTVIDYRGRTPPSSEAGTIPHVRTTQFRDGRIDWNVDRFVTVDTYDTYMTRGLPQRGDVLFTMEAPLGEVGVVDVDHPFSIAQRILLLRPGDGITGDYLALALRSPAVRRAIELRSTGSGVSGVAYKRLRSVLIPKPPLEEQFEIVRKAHAALRTAGEVAAALSSAGDALDRAVRAAAAAAFRGELVAADDLELVV